ncbi:hypothetical protein WS72_13240 [Burkholderia savannae]|uniref:DUF2783 domain-containing protein n=1 Tax=Burkholderia savannae TaxID=1637837 RepID=A0ABR5TIM5_9BURK|nr:hypothetical protein [Burkholderia savannae]KWZ43724.1 hypothetical protein WS72_13240 [Burkholderia savannae]
MDKVIIEKAAFIELTAKFEQVRVLLDVIVDEAATEDRICNLAIVGMNLAGDAFCEADKLLSNAEVHHG